MQNSFFKEMAMIGPGFQVTMTIKEKHGKLTISFTPDGIEKVQPLIITGTPEELEEGFWPAVRKPMQNAHGIKLHNEEYEKSLAAAKKTEKPSAKAAATTKTKPETTEDESEDDVTEESTVKPDKKVPASKPPQKKEDPGGPRPIALF